MTELSKADRDKLDAELADLRRRLNMAQTNRHYEDRVAAILTRQIYEIRRKLGR